MATVGGGNTPLDGNRKGLSLYGSFERAKGGLLYVAQAAFVLLALLVHWFIGPRQVWMAVLVIIAIYGGYFVVRWPLWRALYRQRGHLEHEGLLKESRHQVWVVVFLAFVLPLGLVFGRGYPGPLWPLLGGSVVVATMVIAFGRLPVDTPILTLITITVHHTWLAAYAGESFRSSPGIWLAFVAGLAIWGLIEHYTWLRSGAGDASGEDDKGDAA